MLFAKTTLVKIFVIGAALISCVDASAKIKVEDYWSDNGARCVYSHYKDIKNYGWYHPGLSLRSYVLRKDTVYLVVFKEFVSKPEDPEFLQGHKMMVRLSNNDVLTFNLTWEAKPVLHYNNAYNSGYNEPYIYPAYRATAEEIEKMINIGVKKIRLEHSQGFNDYYIEKPGKCNHTKAVQKLMSEMWEGVRKQLTLPAPPKPYTPSTEF